MRISYCLLILTYLIEIRQGKLVNRCQFFHIFYQKYSNIFELDSNRTTLIVRPFYSLVNSSLTNHTIGFIYRLANTYLVPIPLIFQCFENGQIFSPSDCQLTIIGNHLNLSIETIESTHINTVPLDFDEYSTSNNVLIRGAYFKQSTIILKHCRSLAEKFYFNETYHLRIEYEQMINSPCHSTCIHSKLYQCSPLSNTCQCHSSAMGVEKYGRFCIDTERGSNCSLTPERCRRVCHHSNRISTTNNQIACQCPSGTQRIFSNNTFHCNLLSLSECDDQIKSLSTCPNGYICHENRCMQNSLFNNDKLSFLLLISLIGTCLIIILLLICLIRMRSSKFIKFIHPHTSFSNQNSLTYESHLISSDLQPVPKSDHNINVFDNSSHQSNADLHLSNSNKHNPLSTIRINKFYSSHLMPLTTVDDYERRFKRSLQKLTLPQWYTDNVPNISSDSKQSINSNSFAPWKAQYREAQRTPEIVHVRGPRSYRSCRSSLATSPSPSVHSWHPNHMIDGANFSISTPSSSRRRNKYENGVERVSKSSRWYKPTRFVAAKTTSNQIGTNKITTLNENKHQLTINNHYDTPKTVNDDGNSKTNTHVVVTNNDSENSSFNEQQHKLITTDKQQDDHIEPNESQIMPLAKKEVYSCVELEEVTDEEDNQSLLMINKKPIPSITDLSISNDQIYDNALLEQTANDLVQTILTDILTQDKPYDDDDKNSGVRELSEDESGLRELDEDDINDNDEFIVLATQPDVSDEEHMSNIPRNSLNRLYTFSKATNHNSLNIFQQATSNQNTTKSILEIKPTEEQSYDSDFIATPIYISCIEKQDIYSDEILRSSSEQSSIHQSNDGVNEETVRIGRILLNSIPTSYFEDIHQIAPIPISIQSKIKPTENFLSSIQNDNYSYPQQLIIDEYNEILNDKVRYDSAYSSNQERINVPQTFYEPLSECYSGYTFTQHGNLTPNISSLQSTTDEAYESEPTTLSSSIGMTKMTYVHPNLEHEFEYPSPPPPVPDRRLKPTYLKLSPPLAKPRSTKQNDVDLTGYSTIQKTKPSPISEIKKFVTTIPNDSPSTRTMSSRHYCGSIPVANEQTKSNINSPTLKNTEQHKDKNKEKRNIRTFSCLYPSTSDDVNEKNLSIRKSPLTLKSQTKKHKIITDFDEATNGLAIRLPAPVVNGTLTPSSKQRINGSMKDRHIKDNITKPNRSLLYETSV